VWSVISSHQQSIYTVRQHFPNALIVVDRFHLLRIINHHFLACWRDLDPVGSKNRGLLSLMRRHRHRLSGEQQARLAAYLAGHPALELIYRSKQRLCYLLLKKHRTRRQCETLVPRFLRAVYQLRQAGLAQLFAVRVRTDGFEYDGRIHRSLSAIAREVAGTNKWNGFLFFNIAPQNGRLHAQR
jgi:transposase